MTLPVTPGLEMSKQRSEVEQATQEAVAEKELGNQVAFFGPSWPNVIAGTIISILIWIAASVLIYLAYREFYWNMPMFADKGMCWFAFLGMNALGIGFFAGGGFLLYLVKTIAGRSISIRQLGLLYREPGRAIPAFWEDIELVKEIHLLERPPVLKGPAQLLLPKLKSISYIVFTHEGTYMTFDGNTVNNLAPLGEALAREVKSRDIEWIIEEVHV